MPATSDPETEAFAVLVVEHQAGLRAWVRSLGVDEAWVDDFAQEAFLVAYRKRAEWDAARGPFGGWLRGIARHLVIAARRKGARRARLLDEALCGGLLESADEESGGDFPFSRPEMTATLEQCIEALGGEGRDLLRRRYAQGETALSLAEQFRLSAEAMRQRLLRLRLAVKQCIERKLGADLWT